jgi:hypothetical protein
VPPSVDELRAAIPWVDGDANVWRLFADALSLGAAFVAIRKTDGRLPGPVLTEATAHDDKGEAGRLRLQADALARDEAARTWLRRALGPRHPWLERLTGR